MNEEVARLNIQDFKAPSGAKQREDEELDTFLKENFLLCVKAQERGNREADRLWGLFENLSSTDYYDTANIHDEDTKKLLFKASMVSTKVWILACIISEQMQRIYLDPVFWEDADQFIGNQAQSGNVPQWMQERIREEGMHGFWNSVLDNVVDYWWKRGGLYTKTLITKVRAMVQGKAWVKLRVEDGEIIYENVPLSHVFEDPTAETRDGRRFLFHARPTHVRNVELEFNLPKGSVKAEMPLSGLRDGLDATDKSIPDEKKYMNPQCRVVEAWFKDDTKNTDGSPKYPYGRVIQFLMGQDTQTGIKRLADFPNGYRYWTLFDYIPRPATETKAIPVARNIEPIDAIATRALQQGIRNIAECATPKLLYQADAIDADKISNNVEKIPVEDVRSAQYIMPVNLAADAQNLYNQLSLIADDVSSIHEASYGRRPRSMESGRAIYALQASDVRSANPYIENFRTFLTPLARVLGQMVLEVHGKGSVVRCGDNFRTSYALPFSLYSVISDVDSYIGVENEIPMDKDSQLELIMALAPRLPLKTILRFMPIENKERMMREVDELEMAKQMIAQQQQQVEQMGQQLEQGQQAVQEMDADRQQMEIGVKAGVIGKEYDAVAQDKQAEITLMREDMRQKGKLKDTMLRGAIEAEIERIRGANLRKAGSSSNTESRKR